MKSRWSLCVKNFGKIESAEIEVSPLMIFIGDNNSGKSYLMSLLWGVINKSYELLATKEANEFNSYKELKKWYDINLHKDNVIVNMELRKIFVAWFNDILKTKKDFLIKSIFNKEISIDEIYIKLIHSEDELIIIKDIETRNEPIYDAILGRLGLNRVQTELTGICYSVLFSDYKKMATSQEEPLFLPASRTGFMLTYKTLINESLKSSFGNENIERSKFTTPIINFLNKFVNLDVGINNQYIDIVNFIEKELLKGNIVKDESPVKNIYYKPNNLNHNLPLYLTSSLVTEVAPLVLFLSDVKSDFKTLIIEEPEAHLHLKAQIAMARVVARLVNLGLNVWLTTHSDTFVQQLNNLMKLNTHKDKEKLLKEFNFIEEECLDINKVKVYEFDSSNEKTTITNIKGSNTGFPFPTFNKVIYKLTDEIMALEEEGND